MAKKTSKKKQESELQIFGLETDKKDAQLVLIPVPWEVTASYGSGTSSGPELIFEASSQVDLFDIEVKNAYECGYYMLPVPQKMKTQNVALRKEALKVNKTLQNLQKLSPAQKKIQDKINKANDAMIDYVYSNTKEILKSVYEALKEKGYNPINQIVGYILSGDPTYITSHNNARSLIMKVERDELVEEVIKYFIEGKGL